MIKNTVNGIHTMCDRCRCILATNFNYITESPSSWVMVDRPKKGAQGHRQVFTFCNEKCKLVYFKGQKYWSRKMQHWQDCLKKLDGN